MLEHERKYIQSLENVVNRYIPSRSVQEYNKEKYQNNKETDHYKKHIQCRCGRKYTEQNKHNHLKTQYHKNYILSILYINAE